MTSTDKAECTTTECDNVDSVNILVRVPPFWSDDVLCFAMLEAQFGAAGLRADDATFLTVISNIDRAVRAANPKHTDRSYEFLKKEFVRRLGDLDAKRVRKLIENEEIGRHPNFTGI
jgi:hypothetical protein